MPLTRLEVSKDDFLDWISDIDVGAKHQSVKSKRTPGSGKWFLSHPEYQRWLGSSSSQKLYCPGERIFLLLLNLNNS